MPNDHLAKFTEAQHNLELQRVAPRLLDALRLLHLMASPDHLKLVNNTIDVGHMRTILNNALEGTEDL